jgi:hypothetical protein
MSELKLRDTLFILLFLAIFSIGVSSLLTGTAVNYDNINEEDFDNYNQFEEVQEITTGLHGSLQSDQPQGTWEVLSSGLFNSLTLVIDSISIYTNLITSMLSSINPVLLVFVNILVAIVTLFVIFEIISIFARGDA